MISLTSLFSKPSCSPIFSSNQAMPSKPKTSRREDFSEIIAIIISLKSLRKSHDEIISHLKLSKLSITSIIHRHQRRGECSLRLTKRVDRSLQLNARARRRFIRHVETNSRDDFATLTSLSKSTHSIHRATIRSYLRIADYLRFKTRKKLFLTSKHKLA
jgi:transposase